MRNIRTGTITFLFTDIEGSTRRWEDYPQQMQTALALHDAILRSSIEESNGYIFKAMGDAFCAAFTTTSDALQAALAAQLALQVGAWPAELEGIAVRMALHTGSAEQRNGDYFGQPLNRVARLLSAGHGGQVLLSQSTYELLRDNWPPGVVLKDMGEHRLKDLTRPEHIYQLVAPDLQADFLPIKTLDSRPNNLPFQPTPFIGREPQVEAIAKLLRRDDARMVTLTGPGGTGKTRLGLQVAAEMLDDFEDGVFFVNLAPITDPALVVSTIAQTLNVRESAGRALIDSLGDYLSGKKILLLLDNFEQVVEAASDVARLSSASPALKLLVTSRVVLHIRGEKEYPVPPLDLPDAKHLPPLERLTQYEAVRLFIERATDVKPDFQVTNENAPAVAEICARLDGLPLAIELAAARIRLLPPRKMLDRLQSRLKLLTGGARDLPVRQQTLRNAIEWSYDLLNEGEKQLFRRLAVFVGGRSLEAIEAVCNANGDLQVDVLDGLESLIGKSLLRQEEGVGGEPRFVMLETIDEYAREKLKESGESKEINRGHADYFTQWAERNSAKDVIETEYNNLRAALLWLLDAKEIAMLLRIGVVLADFWYESDRYSEGRVFLLSIEGQTQNVKTKERLKILSRGAQLARLTTCFDQSAELYMSRLSLARYLAEPGAIIRATGGLGLLEMELGNYSLAETFLEEALSLARQHQDKKIIGDILHAQSELARLRNDEWTAISFLEEAVSLLRQANDPWNLALALSDMALVQIRLGKQVQAKENLLESLSLYRNHGAQSHQLSFLLGMAGLALQARGDKSGSIRAGKLLGAVDALQTKLYGDSSFNPSDLEDIAIYIAQAQAHLSEQEWESSYHQGQSMTIEQAIDYALEDTVDIPIEL